MVIFDCDGVLVDSELLSHGVLQQMLAEHGAELSLQQTLDHFMGASTERCLAQVAALVGRPAPADFMAHFRDRSFQAFGASLLPVPGIEVALAGLSLPYCVASNGPRAKMQFTLSHTGLLPYFQGRIFSADEVARPKPAPDLFLHAARHMGVAPPQCVVVEDSATGVAAARAAGMQVLGFAAMGQGPRLLAAGAHRLLHAMDALPAALQALGAEAGPLAAAPARGA
jgi:HAD superfamily hydrolase (TIGR01509 family)